MADAASRLFPVARFEAGKRRVRDDSVAVEEPLELRVEGRSVAVVMRGTQNAPGKPPDVAVLALRVALSKDGGKWLVVDVTPINAR